MQTQPSSNLCTRLLAADAEGIADAARFLRAGEVVAFPTETVYGLGADAGNAQAVAQIYAAKGRPSFNPLIVHVASREQAASLVQWSDTASRLADAFWPGALTLVMPMRPSAPVADLVRAGLPTLALRMPAGATARALLNAAGCPVAAPSANPSGRISAVTAQQVLAGLSGRIPAVLDGGPCSVGVESTILGLNTSEETPDDTPRLLRPGGIAKEDIEETLGLALAGHDAAAGITSPGQTLSHYAPAQSLRLNAITAAPGEILIGFGDVTGDLTLSASGDLVEAAARLFTCLHDADATGRPIVVAPIPDHGLGLAINDRLRRAAAPRQA